MSDAPTMKVTSIRFVSHPGNALDRLADLLGLTPTSADAKGLGAGDRYMLRFSRDGHSFYLVDGRGAVSGKPKTHTDLGVERIDSATGELRATSLTGLAVWWMDEAVDGSALYTITPASAGEDGCPCNLERLDPATLDVTASRSFPKCSIPQ